MKKFKITLYRQKIITYNESAEIEIEAQSIEEAKDKVEKNMVNWKFRQRHDWENLGVSDSDVQNYEVGEINEIYN